MASRHSCSRPLLPLRRVKIEGKEDGGAELTEARKTSLGGPDAEQAHPVEAAPDDDREERRTQRGDHERKGA